MVKPISTILFLLGLCGACPPMAYGRNHITDNAVPGIHNCAKATGDETGPLDSLSHYLRDLRNHRHGDLYAEWKDGKVPEFSTAYTLHRHEFRLNIFGPSSFAINDRVELKSYLSAIIAPNLSLKKKFYDHRQFAFAWEAGAAAGLVPIAGATGLLLPGGALAGGTAGILTFTSLFGKLYGTWKPSRLFTFSLRSELARLHFGYTGIGGFAAIGSGGGGVAIFPINAGLLTSYWMSGGFETDFVINPRQAIVLRASAGKLLTKNLLGDSENYLSKNYLLFPSLTWNHSWTNRHVHLSLGVFGVFNPPSNTLTRNSKLPVGYCYNVYWIFHNRKKG